MKKLYVSFLILICLILSLLLLVLGCSNFIDWANHKGFVESFFTKYTGINTKINGNLEISIFPNFRIYAENVEMKSLSGKGKLLEMQHLLIYKNIKDVILLDTSVDELIINRPKITLEIAKDGNSNWEPLKIRNNKYYSRKLQSIAKQITNFKKVNIENGQLLYRDNLKNEGYDISNIYINLTSDDSDIAIDSKFTTKEDYELLTKLDIKDLNNIRTFINLISDSWKLGTHGIITNYNDLNKLSFFGKSELKIRDLGKFNPKKGSLVNVLKEHVNLNSLVAKSDFTYSKNNITISKFEIKTTENELKGSLSWNSNKKNEKSISTELQIKNLKIEEDKLLKDYFDDENWKDTTLDFSFVKDLNIGVAVICDTCSYGDKTLKNLNLRANLANNSLIINQLNLKASGDENIDKVGSLNMTAIIGFNNSISFECKQEYNDFPFYVILPKNIIDKIKFNANGKLNLSSKGTTIKTMLSNLSGTMGMNLKNVELQNINTDNLNTLTDDLLRGQHNVNYNTAVSDLILEGSIRDGVVRHSDIMFNMNGTDYNTKGKLDLANLTLNYRIAPMNISKTSLGEVIRGKITEPEIIQDKITPMGVVDGYGRVVTKEIVKQTVKKKIETPFDYDDKINMKENVIKYLFDKKTEN